MLPCPDRLTLSRYLDGELSEGYREMVEKHLSYCTECRRALVELGAPAAVLKSLKPPARKPGLKCLPEETITAWVEGRLDPKFRRWVASHLADCPACAARAGRIAEDLEAVAAVRKKGLERVPEKLAKLTEDLFGRERSFLGRVAVELERVVSVPEWWRELTTPSLEERGTPYGTVSGIQRAFSMKPSAFEVPLEDYRDSVIRETPAPRERWDFRKKGIRLEVGFGEMKPGFASCLVRVLDETGKPADGAAVTLKGAPKPFYASTDRAGLASLGPVRPGKYLLQVEFGPGAELEIEAR
ncbi:MAG: zf-HC2 domain-containing protein [Candidatus Erginobacter occultus]|nr:zf-HC2 domain-containing protein [Candidatus Erginobacter occultus]